MGKKDKQMKKPKSPQVSDRSGSNVENKGGMQQKGGTQGVNPSDCR